MSISSALNNALSGLTVSARATDVVSSNVANAMTEGYASRSIDIGSRISSGDGAGAVVNGILRDTDPVLTAQRRDADAELAYSRTEAEFLRSVETLVGQPSNPNSLSARLAEFEARLTDAANRPNDEIQLTAAVQAADDLAQTFGDISDGIQSTREQADAAIGAAVTEINQSLQGIADLNSQILSTPAATGDRAAMLDEQARLVDQLATNIQVETRRDQNGALQVFSTGGQILVDRAAAELTFQTTPVIDATMVYGNSILSGLEINGREVAFGSPNEPLGGGELAALFAQRDDWAVEAQNQLDGIARDLVERFDDPGLDATLGPTDAGLFTDGGARFDPTNEQGLAARLSLNAAVQPDEGGEVWRLRDGLGATTQGPTGDASLLIAQIDALSQTRVTSSDSFSSAPRSLADLMSTQISQIGLSRQTAEGAEANSAAIQSALRQQELSRGVDTDAQMQELIRIENMYAANARVIEAAEAMLDELMRMT